MKNLYGWKWQDYEELCSTNDEACKQSLTADGGPFVITARRQTQGRGRRGRTWSSLEGNLFMSLALPLPPEKWHEVVFVVSLSLLQTVAALAPGLNLRLKWPNDVLLNGGKLSGILLEKGEAGYLIIGIGVNLSAAPQISGLIYPTICLKDVGLEVDRQTFLAAFLRQFNAGMELWRREGFASIRDKWLENVKGLDQQINVTTEKETKTGIFRGLSENGMLLLEQDGNLIKICAGDVFYLSRQKEKTERYHN